MNNKNCPDDNDPNGPRARVPEYIQRKAPSMPDYANPSWIDDALTSSNDYISNDGLDVIQDVAAGAAIGAGVVLTGGAAAAGALGGSMGAAGAAGLAGAAL